MPYSIDEEGGVLRARFVGALTGTELHAFIDEVDAKLAPRPQWPNNLIDLRAVELSALGFTDMMSIAKRREAIQPPSPIRTAILADSPALTGFARMFQSLNHNPNITIQVFSDAAEAESWLLSQPR
jgi:hypothetical protein